jgi:hypothetical protein
MTAVGASPGEILYDMVLTMGFGLGLWFSYHLCCLLIPMKNKVVALGVHVLFFSAAGFLAFCFIVGMTVSQQPRWHMALGLGLAAWAYYGLVARYVQAVLFFLEDALRWMVSPVVRLGRLLKVKVWDRMVKRLQSRMHMMYNTHVKKRQLRRVKRRKNGQNEPQKEKRKPIQAYTET